MHRQYLDAAPNVLGTQGAAIIANIGDELGMVINPGAAYGFEINPRAWPTSAATSSGPTSR